MPCADVVGIRLVYSEPSLECALCPHATHDQCVPMGVTFGELQDAAVDSARAGPGLTGKLGRNDLCDIPIAQPDTLE